MAFKPVVVGAFVAVFVVVYALMLTDRIHKTVAAIVGAVGISEGTRSARRWKPSRGQRPSRWWC